jgi:glycosyltransferase involved in cell wall biosynthesis
MMSPERGLVSVCIPSYNASRHIHETIRSVLDSTYTHFEIIVSDDASTDNTAEVVEAIGDSRIRLFRHEQNIGVPRNWNRAVKQAQGEWVCLLNHDDLYGPFWFSFATHILRKYPHIGWVATCYRIIDAQDRTIAVQSTFAETRQYDPVEAFPVVARLDGLGPGPVVRRDILEAVGYYHDDAGPGADNDLFLRLAALYPLYYSHIPHAAWRWHKTNLTHQWSTFQQVQEGLEALRRVFSSDCFPASLRPLIKPSYIYFYRKIFLDIDRLLQSGDLDSIQELFALLAAKGYDGTI